MHNKRIMFRILTTITHHISLNRPHSAASRVLITAFPTQQNWKLNLNGLSSLHNISTPYLPWLFYTPRITIFLTYRKIARVVFCFWWSQFRHFRAKTAITTYYYSLPTPTYYTLPRSPTNHPTTPLRSILCYLGTTSPTHSSILYPAQFYHQRLPRITRFDI